jgi:hypothetical protein
MNLNPVGRRPHPITYVDVHYNQKDYVVGFLIANDEEIAFVFDKEEYESVRTRNWHRSANAYVSSSVIVDGTKKELYMHNLVMGRMGYNGKGQTETVDHINRNGFDNRKENLRIATQSNQNINQRQRSRAVVLPEECGIAAEEIPRHIWYIHKNGSHGDRLRLNSRVRTLYGNQPVPNGSEQERNYMKRSRNSKNSISNILIWIPQMKKKYMKCNHCKHPLMKLLLLLVPNVNHPHDAGRISISDDSFDAFIPYAHLTGKIRQSLYKFRMYEQSL